MPFRSLQPRAAPGEYRWPAYLAVALIGLVLGSLHPDAGVAQPNRTSPGMPAPGIPGGPGARPPFIMIQPPGMWPGPGMVVVPPPPTQFDDVPRRAGPEQRPRPAVRQQERRLPEVKKAKPKSGPQCPEKCDGTKEVDCVTAFAGYVLVRKTKSMPDGTTQEYDEPEPVYKNQCKQVPDCRIVCATNPKVGIACPQVCVGTKDVDCGPVLVGYSKVRKVRKLPDGKEEEYFEDQPVYQTECKKVPDCREVCRRKKPKIGGDPQCTEDCSATKDVDCKIVLAGYTKVSGTRTLPDGSKEEYSEDQPIYKNECKKVPDCKKVCI